MPHAWSHCWNSGPRTTQRARRARVGGGHRAVCAMRLLAETRDLFFILGQADGSRLAETALHQCPERNRHRAWLMISAGHLAFQLGKLPGAAGLMTQAAEMSALNWASARPRCGAFVSRAAANDRRRARQARGHLTTARAIQQETGDLIGEARSTAVLGLLTRWRVMRPAPVTSWRRRSRWAWEPRTGRSQGGANLYLGILTESSADPQAASSYFREAIECQRPYGDSTLLPVALLGQASVLTRRDPATALQVVAAASAVRARNGGEFAPFFRALAERTRAAAAERVASDADRLWRNGSRLAVDDAIALAFGTARPRISHALGISERETEVVRLVAEGLSNKEIAGRLHLSVRTVESHVRHMLTKTGLINRTQLATWARERGE